jgi:MYXO-CTERM domain-containing protein
VSILKAGGDAGQLGKTFTLAVNLTALAGHGEPAVAGASPPPTSPWLLVAAGLGAAWWRRISRMLASTPRRSSRLLSVSQRAGP